MATLAIPGLAFFPIHEVKVGEFIENVLLVIVNIKNVWLILSGQILVILRHAMQKFTLFDILFIESLLVLFIVKELKFQAIVVGNMKINEPSWGLFVQFGMIPMTVFFGFGVFVIADVKGGHRK